VVESKAEERGAGVGEEYSGERESLVWEGDAKREEGGEEERREIEEEERRPV